MLDRSRKLSRKRNKLAKLAADVGVGRIENRPTIVGKNPAAVALGRLGGQKGGVARAQKLSAAVRSRIATKAAKARWGLGGTSGDAE